MIKIIYIVLINILFIGCSFTTPKTASSATILIKTPTMKFYDKGFINRYDNHVEVQIYSAGQTVLDLKIYEDRVCKSTFKCISSSKFNEENLDKSYEKDFLLKLFTKNEKSSIYRDKKNGILIKIKKD